MYVHIIACTCVMLKSHISGKRDINHNLFICRHYRCLRFETRKNENKSHCLLSGTYQVLPCYVAALEFISYCTQSTVSVVKTAKVNTIFNAYFQETNNICCSCIYLFFNHVKVLELGS